jgi:hypothetical protein
MVFARTKISNEPRNFDLSSGLNETGSGGPVLALTNLLELFFYLSRI